ncbi:ATP-dependent endonuclease [Thermodesulfobacteriota bacterium]
MKLIKSIEISYFRSIYKQKLDRLADLSILFGRNDSGKSNFLRALNLFFNSATNPDQVFDFSKDFNDARLDEAAKGADTRKFVYIKITFIPPNSWQPSLGKSFWVKKTWSVSRGDTFILENSLPSVKQQFVTKFLNKIQYHYIPAIKDRSIFENLFAQVYQVLSMDEAFLKSLDTFAQELQTKTSDISSDLLNEMGIHSVIAPPNNLTDLFRSLDFETKNEFGDTYSLTLQKGDGIQVRHIPTILGFLSDKSSQDYHIWGFEEPENSLELASAVEEADSFIKYAKSKNKQIFITSHSPAFFSIENDYTNRYFISKQNTKGLSKNSSEADLIKAGEDLPNELMGETPLLPIISHYLKESTEKIQSLKEGIESINTKLSHATSPILFVEGESDKIIFQKCWELFGAPEYSLVIEDCYGSTKMKSLSQDGLVIENIGNGREVFILVDNDKEGRELYKNKRLGRGGGGNWVMHNSNKTYWCRLKISDDFKQKMKTLNIPENSWPYTIENCFDQNNHKKAIEKGVLRFEEYLHDELIKCDTSNKIVIPLATSDDHTYLRAPNKEKKIPYANWIVNQHENDPSVLEPFRLIFENLLKILKNEIN